VGTDISNYSAKFDNKGSYNSSVDKSAENIAGFVNFDINHNSWLMNAGARRDDNSLHSSVNTYRLGVGYLVNDVFTLTAGTNTGFKAPSLYEMYGADNYGYTGNPNLTEEKSVTYETGIKTKVEGFESQFNIFTTRVSDQISYGNSTYSNDTDGAHVTKGWEFSSTQSMDDTRLSISVTGLSAQDSAKKEVTRRPKLSSYVGIEHDMSEKLTLWGTYNYYGKHRDIHPTSYATVDMDKQTTVDAGFGYSVNEDVVVNGTVTNIGDLEYERPYGYNQDRTAFNISVKYLF
jgi:vitamin B12 transporter